MRWRPSPRLLLLDEPASGLAHAEVDELGETIRGLRDQFGLTVLLVEHHMQLVMGISDKVVVLDFGRKIAEGCSGRGAERSQASSRHISEARPVSVEPMTTMLQVAGLDAGVRADPSAARRRVARRRRRGGRPARRQRGRQDHDDPGHLSDDRQQGQRQHVRH